MRRSDLIQLLEAHTGSTALERDYRERMLALVNAGSDPFMRHNYRPGHFTCSSFVLSPTFDALLLIFHSKLRRWLQPGGHVEGEDRDVFAAARREVSEETGVEDLRLLDGRTLFDLDIHQIPGRAKEPGHEHFDLRFLFVAPSLQATAGSDALDFQWVRLKEVSNLESDASVMRAVEKLMQRGDLSASA